MKSTLATIAAAAVLLATGLFAFAQETSPAEGPPHAATPPAKEAESKPLSDKPVITTATLTPADGKTIDYTATTGYMPLKDEKGKLRANVFYVAYTAGKPPATQPASTQPTTQATQPTPDLSTRPIMFVFNGGPGAASVWLHIGAVGPRRLDIPDDGTAPTPPFKLVENQFSWLPSADLVFIDPVNTGYSRADSPEQAKEFLGVREDISGMAEFIRLYLTKYQRWSSPVFLAGESYGTTRASGLADYLQQNTGVSVSGVVLISTVLNFSAISPSESNDVPYALYLPTYAACAWYHNKIDHAKYADLAALLKDAEEFAGNAYTIALMKGTMIPDAEKFAVAKRFSELTSLPESYILESHLRVPPFRFEKQLLRSSTGEGDLVIGRFDGRIKGHPTDAINDSQEYDPSLSGFFPAYASAFNNYVRGTLNYQNDFSYEVLSNKVYPWNWSSGGEGNAGGVYIGDHLRDAMTQNPHLKLLVCSGHFDLATPYFATNYQLNHMTLAPDIRKNISQTYYDGGHMLYHVHSELAKLHDDVTAFITTATAK